uniref:Myotilin n=1 Tax=Poecilia formosa TaxID=48698 RepID=A0A096LX65_POEFO
MSLTISSSSSSSRERSSSSSSSSTLLAQRHSSLVHPLCVSPQRTQSPVYNQQYSGKGVAPTFVKCLHDMSTVKGQLVVLECRLRGTPPLQVMWYREDEQIQDSDDFRILRKKGSSASVPEELCTLVITEAFPEDSGLFKCVVLNSYGTVSCSATLEVYNGEDSEAEHHEETASFRRSIEDLPPVLPDCMNLPPPEWPDSPLKDSIHGADINVWILVMCMELIQHCPKSGSAHAGRANLVLCPEETGPSSEPQNMLQTKVSLPEPEPASCSEEPLGRSKEESALSSEGQRSPDVPVRVCKPSPPPPPAQVKEKTQTPKLFTPSKLSFTSGGNNMNLSDLPSFTPGAFPPSAFNYERPRHFIQSQAAFQAPSYESVLRSRHRPMEPPSPPPPHPASTLLHPPQPPLLRLLFLPAPPCSLLLPPRPRCLAPPCAPPSPSPPPPGSPAPPALAVPACPPTRTPCLLLLPTYALSCPPRSPPNCLPAPASPTRPPLPKPILKKSVAPRPSSSRSTDEDIQGSKDALIQDLEKKLRSKEARRRHSQQKLSYEERMARRLLGPDNATYMLDQDNLSDLQLDQVLRFSGWDRRAATEKTFHSDMQPYGESGVTKLLTHLGSGFSPENLPSRAAHHVELHGKPVSLSGPLNKLKEPPLHWEFECGSKHMGHFSKFQIFKKRDKCLHYKFAQICQYSNNFKLRSFMVNGNAATGSSSMYRNKPEIFCFLGRHHSGTDERTNEGSAIQEKCFAPRFLQIPPDLTVEEGRFCRIDFKVSGLPAPDISWYLDGKAIRPDDYHKMLVCEKGMHSFIIEIVTVHHAGVYECVAKNRAGEGKFTMRLDVIAQEALRPPTFVQKMLNTRALEGDTIRLECKVDASPPPQLFWKKDKDMLRIDPNRMSLYQDGSGRQCLLIDRVTKSDSGWYTLSAINEAGMSTCNARLDIGNTWHEKNL